jgi:cell division protease FtsH
MSEKPSSKPPKLPKAPRSDPPPGAAQPSPWKGASLLLILGTLLLIGFWAHKTATAKTIREIDYPVFHAELQAGRVGTVTLLTEPSTGINYLQGEFKEPLPADAARKLPAADGYRVTVNLGFQRDLPEVLASHGFSAVAQPFSDNQYTQIILSMLPFVLFILVMYFFFRQQLKSAGRTAFSFGKSKAKILNKDKNKITFKDVAGVDEAKEEVQEIVEFLKDPKKFQRLGGRIPKGVLMVGLPGTGKTLLAKAIAGEADVPFYGISGSDFVEMFVGVGASRVRDMFEQGRKNAPCLIFIDEIDAVGRSRGHGLGGGHDEREQTLNALLVEMDGIDTQEGVIIIAATNRKDVLDPALLRPGRFDREVRVSLPDVKGRAEILRVHATKVKVEEAVDWSVVARGTPGFSGAELANLLNEAALAAARRDAKAITHGDLMEARDKVAFGKERRSLAMTEKQKRLTAYHEAGHAVLSIFLEHTDPLEKVTIIPRGAALGATFSLPKDDDFLYGYARYKLLDDLCMTMGGRVAEEIFLGDVSTGASGDIRMATNSVKNMVCRWGMSEKLGMVEYGDHDDYVFLGREISRSRGYSEDTARQIDAEVLRITNEAYERAKQIIAGHREQTEALALALLEYETLDGKQCEEIVRTGRMSNPPPKGLDAPVMPAPQESLGASPLPDKRQSEDGGPLPGLPEPAGA